MKVTIAYISEEQEEAAAVLAALLRRFPGAKVRRSSRNPPFLHIYLSMKQIQESAHTGEDSHCI